MDVVDYMVEAKAMLSTSTPGYKPNSVACSKTNIMHGLKRSPPG